jgi:hypothetical protein
VYFSSDVVACYVDDKPTAPPYHLDGHHTLARTLRQGAESQVRSSLCRTASASLWDGLCSLGVAPGLQYEHPRLRRTSISLSPSIVPSYWYNIKSIMYMLSFRHTSFLITRRYRVHLIHISRGCSPRACKGNT